MAISQTPVTGPIVAPDESVPAHGQVALRLSGPDREGDTIIGPVELSYTLDGSGWFTGSLWPNAVGDRGDTHYRMTVSWWDEVSRTRRSFERSLVVPPTGGPYSVADLYVDTPPAVTDETLLAQVQALLAEAEDQVALAAAEREAAEAARDAVLAYGVVAPAFTTWTVAGAATIPAGVQYIWVEGLMYRRLASGGQDEFTTAGGVNWIPQWVTAAKNLPILLMWAGQSNALGTSTAAGGERATRNGNVYVWEQIASRPGQTTGWKNAGPDSVDWPYGTEGNHSAYQLADMIQRATGRVVCVVGYGAGGQPLSDFMPSGGGVAGATGDCWLSLQAAFGAAIASVVPGRSDGATFVDLGVTEADLLLWCQGEADADYRVAVDTAASTHAQYLARFVSIEDAMRTGAGTSADPILKPNAPIILQGLLVGGTSGGNPTDDRNTALQKLGQGRLRIFVPSDDLTSTDNLHFDAVSLVDMAWRAYRAYMQFPKQAWVEYGTDSATGTTWEKHSDGRLIMEDRSISTVATTTATGQIFKAAASVTWTFPTGADIPEFVAYPFVTVHYTGASTRWATVQAVTTTGADIMAFGTVSGATALTIAARAEGRWVA